MSDDISDNWDEVFEGLEVKAVPIEYLVEILLHLTDGRTIVIDANNKGVENVEQLEDDLDEFIESYDDLIDTIDFRVDVDKVKKDITEITKAFMKRTR